MSEFGDQVGPLLAPGYEIEREIGRGGAAVVFAARDVKHQRRVAIKVLRPELSATLAADRFLREIRVAARLNHPHILALHDSGSANGYLYLVTPLAEGETLRARLGRETRLPIEDAMAIGRDVAMALAYSHAHGVIHRDIKPENILLSGVEAVVADFGIAHAVQEAGEERLTQSGIAIGTTDYMAPEQAFGEIDARSDIYSLGCVLFEMLAGEPPFSRRPATSALAHRSRGEPPSVAARRPGVPRQLDETIRRALAVAPDERFATAEEMVVALRAISAEYVVSGPRLARRRRPWRLERRIMAGAASVAALLLAWVIWGRDAAPSLRLSDLVVFPFRVDGLVDTSLVTPDYLVDLVHARLAGEVGPRALDPVIVRRELGRRIGGAAEPSVDQLREVAARLGAGAMLHGWAHGDGGRLTLTAILYDVAEGTASTRVDVDGSADSLPSIVDRFVAQVLLQSSGDQSRHLEDLTTHSLPALRRYLSGMALYRRGQYEAASAELERALQGDSTFALAALQLATVRALSGDRSGDARAMAIAWRNSDRLGRRDRTFLELIAGPRYPHESPIREWITYWQDAIDTLPLPDRWEAWWFLGDLLFHEGKAAGIPNADIIARNQLRQALSADSAMAPVLDHLIELAVMQRDTAEVDRLSSIYFASDSLADNAPFVRWLVLAFQGDRAALGEFFGAGAYRSPRVLGRIVNVAQVLGLDLEHAPAAAEAAADRARGTDELTEARLAQQHLLINRGRPTEATRNSVIAGTSSTGAFLRVVEALYWDGDSAAASAAVRARLTSASDALVTTSAPRAGAMRDVCTVALWQVHGGDFSRVNTWIAALDGVPGAGDAQPTSFIPLCAGILRAEVEARGGGVPGAQSLAGLDSLVLRHLTANGYIRLAAMTTLVRLYARAGDSGRALEAVRRRSYSRDLRGPLGLSTLLHLEGQMAEATGDASGAVDAYEHYLALRSDPEPRLVARVDTVRQALQRLRSGR